MRAPKLKGKGIVKALHSGKADNFDSIRGARGGVVKIDKKKKLLFGKR